MDFASILKSAWKLTWNKKNLWWLGFLAMLTEAGSVSPTFYQLPAIPTSEDKAKAAAEGVWSSLSGAFSSPGVIAAVSLTVLGLFILLLFISYSAKAGLILAVDELGKEKIDDKPVAKKYYGIGQKYAWKIFLFNIVLALIVLFVMAIVVTPMIPVIMALDQTAAIFLFICLIFLASAVLIVFSISMSIVKQLGERMIVLEGYSALKAFTEAIKMLFMNAGNTLLTWLISLAIGFGYSLGSFLVFFFVGLAFALITGLFYFLLKTAGLIFFGVTGGLILTIGFCAVTGAFSTFSSAFWTLSYRKIDKKLK